jgi:phosphonopyruvate decarboxylase
MQRCKFIIAINEKFKYKDKIFIGTTGNNPREIYSIMKDTNNFYMAGNMGGALSLGLGASLGGKKVFVLGGDAEFVMHMGGLTTAGRYKNIDLTYILFDNEQNKSTGGQNTYQSHINYINIAKASNLITVDNIVLNTDELINTISKLDNKYANFAYVKCGLDDETPRPPLEVVKVKEFK